MNRAFMILCFLAATTTVWAQDSIPKKKWHVNGYIKDMQSFSSFFLELQNKFQATSHRAFLRLKWSF